MSVCFFTRCKPQGADAIELVKAIDRAFLGYPPVRKGKAVGRLSIHTSLFDLSRDSPSPTELELWNLDHRAQNSYCPLSANIE